jgi:hypothetical protein
MLVRAPNIKVHENPFNGSRVDKREERRLADKDADRQTYK